MLFRAGHSIVLFQCVNGFGQSRTYRAIRPLLHFLQYLDDVVARCPKCDPDQNSNNDDKPGYDINLRYHDIAP